MTTIAIIGAGPGLGAAVARRFGSEGLSVALISRNQEKLDALAASLGAEGITARGFRADVQEPASIVRALADAEETLGPIDVLQYSPVPRAEFLRPVLETTAADLADAATFSIIGPVTAAQQVLPGMVARGAGTILIINGSSAVRPNGAVAGTSIAFAGESAYGAMLHDAVAPQGVHVGQLIIPGAIGDDDPLYAPEALAERIWQIHAQHGAFRTTVGAD